MKLVDAIFVIALLVLCFATGVAHCSTPQTVTLVAPTHTVTFVPLTPLAPQALVVGAPSVALWWTQTPCPSCTGALTWNLYRGTAPGVCNYINGVHPPIYMTITTLPTQAAPTLDSAVVRGTSYVYAVAAVQGGESNCSAELQIAVPSAPQAPSVPSGQTY